MLPSEVEASIKDAILNTLKLGTLQHIKCGAPPPANSLVNSNKKIEPKEETFWAYVVFEHVD